MITLSIDLKLIDQAKCKKITRKNGEAATFCDLVLIETPGSPYGDYVVKQDSTREAREAGEKMPILGNAKNRERKAQSQGGNVNQPPAQRQYAPAPDDDEIPF